MSRSRASTQRYIKYAAMELEDDLMDTYACNYNYDNVFATSQQSSGKDNVAELQMLVAAFPEVDASVVQDIYIAKNYDLCATAEALSGLMAPEPTVQSDTDEEDQWSFHDEMEDNASVASLDWVVVQDEWDVAEDEIATESCRSYSDVLLTPFTGNGVPFAFLPPSKPTRDSPAEASNTDNESDSYEEINDYYGIKEYAQRRAHQDRTHPKKGKAAKSVSKKTK
ncbi:hypothetical protein THRCLA_04452 [Thraustotheca clavata]|uniref:CUE domain-containing protein n=1 Tax=Thraustotheca clavata TaxID=74557 RepID=A0A1V9ZZ17_9STRA|nr:hypothetical protein THRCLA_04452 [Thraustotheca clavata]